MIGALLAATAVAVGGGAGGGGAGAGSLPVLGFQSGGTPPSRIALDAPALAAVGIDGVNLTGRAGAVATPSAADHAQLAASHAAGRPGMLLVGNYSDRIGDFSEPLAWRTLRSADARRALARTLAASVRADGFDGVSVDLESLRARDRPGLVALLRDLRARLGPGASLTVCVQSETSPGEYVRGGYDLPSIAATVDQLVLMAYDQHGPWERTPGPVGADRWVRAGLSALLRSVPASQVDLGVAGYGYVWGPHARRLLSDRGARALVRRAGGRARWDARAGEWTARLRGGRTVWWSDGRTLARRAALASARGLHGLALWSLGLSDPLRR